MAKKNHFFYTLGLNTFSFCPFFVQLAVLLTHQSHYCFSRSTVYMYSFVCYLSVLQNADLAMVWVVNTVKLWRKKKRYGYFSVTKQWGGCIDLVTIIWHGCRTSTSWLRSFSKWQFSHTSIQRTAVYLVTYTNATSFVFIYWQSHMKKKTCDKRHFPHMHCILSITS